MQKLRALDAAPAAPTQTVLATADICPHGGSSSLCEWCGYKAQVEHLKGQVKLWQDREQHTAELLIGKTAPAVTDITTSRDGWKALAKENRDLLQAACAEREQYREALEALGLHPMAMQTYCEKYKLVDYNNPEHRNPIGWRKLIVEHVLKASTTTRPEGQKDGK